MNERPPQRTLTRPPDAESVALLARATRLLTPIAPLEDQVARLLDRLCGVLGADAAVVRELQGHKMPLVACSGVEEHSLAPVLQADSGLPARILATRRPLVVADCLADPRIERITRPQGGYGPFSFVSYAGVPMIVAGEVVGILATYATRHPRDYSEADLNLLRSVGDAIGMALAHRGLLREIVARDRQLQTIATERSLLEKRLVAEVLHDELTGLPTRPLLLEHLEHSIAKARTHEDYRFTLAVLRPNRHPVIVDTMGPRAGDDLILAVRERLEAVVPEDAIMARIGPDQFALLLESPAMGSEVEQALEWARGAFVRPFDIQGRSMCLPLHIGIVRSTIADGSPEELVQKAEAAQHRALRESGSAWIVYRPEMHHAERELIEMQADIRRGMEAREFFLYYQPIVSSTTLRIAGFEVLLRWNHPVRGLLEPDDFLCMAESAGYVRELGATVLKLACLQTAAWLDTYNLPQDFFVSVNVSPLQMTVPDFERQILDIVAETGIPPRRLKLEITESAVLTEVERTRSGLDLLARRGIGLCIDDFGKGFSSLGRLHQLPFASLKIDRSFVGAIGHDESAAKIVAAIASLAGNLGLSVIAEGIESPTQAGFVADLGIPYLQGFFFSRPVTPERAEQLLVDFDCSLSPT